MKRTLCFVLLVAYLAPCAAYDAARGAETLQESLAQKLDSMDCPGALAGLFPDAGEPQVYVLGVADRQAKTPMSRDLHMRIGSVTKMFVGTVALQLIDEGRLTLDDPVGEYVDGVPAGDRITIRQLGRQTSGLFNSIEDRFFQVAITLHPHKEWTATEILQVASAHPPYDEPGAAFRYSNTNAILLARVIEAVEGGPIADVIQRRICAPLELNETGFSTGGTPAKPYPSAYRYGSEHSWVRFGQTLHTVTDYSASWTGAAGNMYSTLDNLARAVRPLATGELLGAAGRREIQDWQASDDAEFQYSFCLAKWGRCVGHLGDVPGYQVVAAYLPDERATLVVLANQSNNKNGTMPAEELANAMLEAIQPGATDLSGAP